MEPQARPPAEAPPTRAGAHSRRAASLLTVTRVLTVAAVVVFGLGGSLADRALVSTPAWQQLGVAAWATYSRHADLGNGLILYPIWGIASWTLTVAAAIAYWLSRNIRRSAAIPLSAAALVSIGAAATTVKAAPIMLNVANLPNSGPALEQAFRDFTFWGVYVRGALFAIAFVASLWAALALFRSTPDMR